MQKIRGLFILTLFALPMLAACPNMGDGEDPGDGLVSCDPEDPTSCAEDDELCHPYARVCVANCAAQEGACDETALPICGTDDPFTNICQCAPKETPDDSSTCDESEVCHPVTRLCENTCDPESDTCPKVGDEQWECLALENETYDMDHGGDAGVMTHHYYACQPPSGSCTGNETICDADTEHCGPDGQCAPNCTNNAAVGDSGENGTVCMSSGRWLPACIIEDCEEGEMCDINPANETFNFCIDICDDVDCPDDQICDMTADSANYNTCVDLLSLPCTTNGEYYVDTSGGEHACVDGAWEAACDQDVCALEDTLCQDDDTKSTFNECDVADNVTNTGCAGAAAFTATRHIDGPLIHNLVYKADDSGTRDCLDANGDVDTTRDIYLISMHYSDPTGDAHAAFSADAYYNNFLWSEDGTAATFTTNAMEFGANAAGTTGDVTLVLCFSSAPDDLAVQISDELNNVSNVACITREDLLPEPGDTTLPNEETDGGM